MKIGKKIKELRVFNDLTQEELAIRCELSKGFVSQIENDLTSPSISTLADIVEVLGSDLSEFFSSEETEEFVFRSEDYFIDENEKMIRTWLISNAQKNRMEPIILDLAPGRKSDLIEPFEGECFIYVLKGSLIIYYGGENKMVKSGDSVYIHGHKKHYFENVSDHWSQVIWVCTPPNF